MAEVFGDDAIYVIMEQMFEETRPLDEWTDGLRMMYAYKNLLDATGWSHKEISHLFYIGERTQTYRKRKNESIDIQKEKEKTRKQKNRARQKKEQIHKRLVYIYVILM